MPTPTAKLMCMYICMVSLKSHALCGSHALILVGGHACLFDIHATNSIGLMDSAFVFIVLCLECSYFGVTGPKAGDKYS